MLGEQFYSVIYTFGADVVLTKATGDVCPCMNHVDSVVSEYSEEWHRLYPTAEKCNGTGLIKSSTSTDTIRAIVYPVSVAVGPINHKANDWVQEVVGRMKDCDFVLLGAIDTSDFSFYDLTALSEQSDKATFAGVDYRITNVTAYVVAGETLFQIAGLKRLS